MGMMGGADLTNNFLDGNLTATGATPGENFAVRFNMTLSGTFVGTVQIERSFNNGGTWHPLTDEYGTKYTFTAPVSLICNEPERGVLYRLNCTAYTSGTITYRLSA